MNNLLSFSILVHRHMEYLTQRLSAAPELELSLDCDVMSDYLGFREELDRCRARHLSEHFWIRVSRVKI
jgi:hypothetical protein